MTRLRPQEATGLYLLVFAFCIFFFVAGVLVGRWMPRTENPVEGAAPIQESDEPEATEEADLGFMRELVSPPGESSDAENSPVQEEPAAQMAPTDTDASAPPVPDSSLLARGTDQPAGPAFFTVQVGAIENPRTVNQTVMRLTAKGYPSRVIEPGEQGNQAYLIWVEECETRSEAEELEARLRADGFPTYIKQVGGSAGQ